MIENFKILAIIPARGGSKSIPRKNIKMLAGKPLIAWTIEEARKSKYLDRLIISSEDREIIETAQRWGGEVPFTRPAELAADETPGIEPVIHAINSLEKKYDYVLLLQPTSPLRTVSDIDECINYCVSKNALACVSVSPVKESPYWMYNVNGNGIIAPLMQSANFIDRRQDLPLFYALNGAIYLARTDFLLQEKSFISEETLAYIMPAERSVDIDEEMDFLCCEMILGVRRCTPTSL